MQHSRVEEEEEEEEEEGGGGGGKNLARDDLLFFEYFCDAHAQLHSAPRSQSPVS
jgi:hypothetical protein